MLTPRAQELADRCRRTERAVAAYARIAGEGWAARTSRSPEEHAVVARETTRLLLAIGVDDVRKAREAMTPADLSWSRAEAGYGHLCRRRDRLAGDLYQELVDYRPFRGVGRVGRPRNDFRPASSMVAIARRVHQRAFALADLAHRAREALLGLASRARRAVRRALRRSERPLTPPAGT